MPRVKHTTTGGAGLKRSRRERGESSRPPAHTPTHNTMGIVFPTRLSSQRFASLSGRQIMPTKFVDFDALDRLGVTQGVRYLFRSINCEDLLWVYARTYRRITLEVLSTFSCSMSEEWMSFRVFNEEYVLNFEEVGNIFGCFPGQHEPATGPDSDLLYPAGAFWNRISGLPTYSATTAKGSSIRHPCMRIAHRILTSTIFCRSDAGSVLNQELFFLHGMVEHLANVSMDGGAFIAQKLLRTADSESGEICCGGLITHIITASSLGVVIPDDEEPVEGLDQLTIDAFTRMRFIRSRDGGRYSWQIGPHHLHHSFLPDHARTQVGPDTDWLFPPPEEEEQEGDQPHAQPEGLEQRLDALTLQTIQNTDGIHGVQHTLDNLERNLYGFFEYQGYNPYHGPNFGP